MNSSQAIFVNQSQISNNDFSSEYPKSELSVNRKKVMEAGKITSSNPLEIMQNIRSEITKI